MAYEAVQNDLYCFPDEIVAEVTKAKWYVNRCYYILCKINIFKYSFSNPNQGRARGGYSPPSEHASPPVGR